NHVIIVDAAAKGAIFCLELALHIGALLIAFISLIALVNLGLGWITNIFGLESITLESILGIILAPLAFAVGVPWDEAIQAGSYIGQQFVLNEFVAFGSFANDIAQFSDIPVLVVCFSLCALSALACV